MLHPTTRRVFSRYFPEGLAVTVLTLGLVLPTLVMSDRYAPPQDELWNLSSAWTLLDEWSPQRAWTVRFLGHSLPIVTGPFQGAIKTYPLAAWILFFGSSPLNTRLFNCGLGIALGLTCYWALRLLVRRPAALLGFLFPLISTDFALSSPSDFGPFLLQSTFIVGAAGSLVRAYRTGRPMWVVVSALMLGATLGEKLTAIPTVGVGLAALGAVVVLKRELYLRIGTVAAATAALFLPVVPFMIYYLREGTADLRLYLTLPGPEPGYFDALTHNINAMRQDVLATRTPQLVRAITSQLVEGVPELGTTLLCIVGGAMLGWGVRMLLRQRFEAASALLLWPVGAFFLYPIFEGLNHPWHFLPLLPLTLVGVTVFVDRLSMPIEHRYSRIVRRAILGPFLVVLLLMVACTLAAFRQIVRSEGRTLSSPALYSLANGLREQPRRRLVCLDYSVCQPLRSVLGTDFKVHYEFAFTPRDPDFAASVASISSQPDCILILRVVDHQSRPGLSVPEPNSFIDWLNSGTVAFLDSEWPTSQTFQEVARVKANGTEFIALIALP